MGNENDIVIFEDVAYLRRANATVKLNSGGSGSEKPLAVPTTPVPKSPDKTGAVLSWGADNLRPQNLIKNLAELPQAKAIIDWQAKALYSGGLMYGKMTYENGQEKFVPQDDKKIKQFFRETNIKRWFMEACLDYYWFRNPFTEFILNGGRDIISMVSQDAAFCRFGLQNEKTGLIENCYISANWDSGASADELKPIPVVDPYYGRFEALRNGKGFKYIYPTSFPSPGKVAYQDAAWHALVESGWLDVAKAIPAFKKALFENQITVKYHIEIATWYWEWKYEGEWSTKFTGEQKREKMRETLEEIESVLVGTKNTGKSVFSLKRKGDDGKDESAITITAIDDKIKSGVYIEDSQEAFAHILFSNNVDPTLVGNAPGKNMGSGSGSDKRVAFNIYMLTCKADLDVIIEPLEFVRDYNGWDEDIIFMSRNYYIATLDQGKEVSKTGASNSNPNGG